MNRIILAVTLCVSTLVGAMGAQAADLQAIMRLEGEPRERALIEGARQEGKVVMYSAMIENQALRPLKEAFRQKYPFIDVEFWRADTRDLINKALAEARARNMIVDVIEGGGVSEALLRANALEPFRLPGATRLPSAMVDPKGYWVATRVSYFGMGYNVKLVPESEAPRTYQDLLDPKWKGRMAWTAEAETGSATMFISFIRGWMGEQKAEDYLRELGKQDIANVTASPREVVNKVMSGEYAIALNVFLHHPIISAKQGAPVASQPMDPILGNASVMVLAKNAPHPHAALLLMDFLISPEGQEVIRKADYFPSDPSIEVEESVARIIPSKIGMQMFFLSEEELFKSRAKSIELQKKYFRRR
jgi:iron(III) transport system substrate-binding protein